MRLAVFGATGGTGRQLVEQALAQGHEVTAVVRDPARLPVEHSRLRVVQADVFDPASIKPALEGTDAVLSALGPPPPPRADDVTVCSRAVRSILQAMLDAGVRRIVVVSGAWDPGDGALHRVLLRPLLHRVFGRLYADVALMEAQLQDSSTEWTIFRPPLLTNGPLSGRYRTMLGRNASGFRVSRADLADAMLRSLEDAATVRTTVGIAG
jgi:putative NADH-flavin reductase